MSETSEVLLNKRPQDLFVLRLKDGVQYLSLSNEGVQKGYLGYSYKGKGYRHRSFFYWMRVSLSNMYLLILYVEVFVCT